MIFELRQYRCWPGKRDEWVRFMEEVVIPFQISKGAVVVGSFVGEEEDDLYVWIRRFDNEEQRDSIYKAIYESDQWNNEIVPRIGGMINRDNPVVTRLNPTSKSVIR